LSSIADYRLNPQLSRNIRDTYFDTFDGKLKGQLLGLRIREIDRLRLIAIKGPSKHKGWGALERLEIEESWSKEALIKIIVALSERGIKTSIPHQDFDMSSPLQCMRHLGYIVIQERETFRQIRNIVPSGETAGQELAEMAVDSVSYHFDQNTICHYEIEIESKSEKGLLAVKSVVEGLKSTFGPAIRNWDYGKLITGKAVEKLLKQYGAKELVDSDNNLKPLAYEKMKDFV
jgi:uncharacterized protein YjbK